MASNKSPKGRKRTSKSSVGQSSERENEGAWDCSVCTFKNNPEAFKCAMCDVRKGTSTRKPRLNPDIVALQQAQALTPPPPAFSPVTPAEQPNTSVSVPSPVPSSSKSEAAFEPPTALEEEEPEPEPEPITTPSPSPSASKVTKKASTSSAKKSEARKAQNKARLKNVDRSSATYHSVTVDDFTVVITEFKPKVKKEKKEKISNGSSNGDKKDKIKQEIKEESGEGSSRNGISEFGNSPNKIKTEAKPVDSTGNGINVKGEGSSNANPSVNHENGVSSRLSMDTSRSS